MTSLNLARFLMKRASRWVHVAVRFVFVLILISLVLFVFLRFYGVPRPLVREVIKRANQAGLPVDVDGIFLTGKGWRADHLHYYSSNPDDLKPLLEIRQFFFSPRDILPNEDGWSIKLLAVDVDLVPPKNWRVDVEGISSFKHVDKVGFTVNFKPDRITLSDGNADWLGVLFSVNGSFIGAKGNKKSKKGEEDSSAVPKKSDLPPLLTREQFEKLEDIVDKLSLTRGANAELSFLIDSTDYSATWFDFNVKAEEIKLQDFGFSKGELFLSYAYPTLRIDRARLFKGEQMIWISGEYNVNSKEIKSTLNNTIEDKKLLLFLPINVREYLKVIGFSLDHIPSFKVNVDSTLGAEFFERMIGKFDIQNIDYNTLKIGALHGNIKRVGDRLEFTELKGLLLGQTGGSTAKTSSMQGGPFEGTVFWDAKNREFGVKGDAQFDPNLLVGALSRIKIATNVIQRFSFKDHPPNMHLELGSNIDNWSAFYIDARVLAKNVVFRGVDLSSLNLSATYKSGKLNIAPIVALQGIDLARGSAMIDFRSDTVVFDIESSMNLVDLGKVVFPRRNLFKTTLKSAGKQQLSASGIIGWGGNGKTDFKASVKTEFLESPIVKMNQVGAEIVGKGSVFSVQNIEFLLCGGQGSGEFLVQLDSATKTTPCQFDLNFSKVDVKQLIENSSRNPGVKTSGECSGTIHCAADFSTNFLYSAQGFGALVIENGQLKDLPLFREFSKVIRKIFPTFTVFSITSLKGEYTFNNGVILSDKMYFGGSIISASAKGVYSLDEGFDAYIYAQILNESRVSKLLRLVTDPLMKVFQFRLKGPIYDPKWELQNFPKQFFLR